MNAAVNNKFISHRFRAREVLEFFFPETIGKAIKLWYGRCEQNDAVIKRRFSVLTKQALDGELDNWLCSATETLGKYCIKTRYFIGSSLMAEREQKKSRVRGVEKIFRRGKRESCERFNLEC